MSEGCPFLHNPYPGSQPASGAVKRGREDTGPASLLGFETTEKAFIMSEKPAPTHYATYLGIPALLSNQDGPAACKPDGKGLMHHEEMTFIVIHQVFELWFKLVISDLTVARDKLIGLTTNTDEEFHNNLTLVGNYLRRSEGIIQHVAGAFGIMETMHPADFIEFRDYLIPASGFQSVQFRSLEQLFGVQREARSKVNGKEVFAYLQDSEQAKLKDEGEVPSLNSLVEKMLNAVVVPDAFMDAYFTTTRKVLEEQQFGIAGAHKDDPSAKKHVETGLTNMKEMLENPLEWSEGLYVESEEGAKQYKKAVLAALFIISYRHSPRFSRLAGFLDSLIAVEQAMLLWRGRHMHMAERMIGRRAGTGGTGSGVGYLDVTRRYRVFHCLWLVRKLFIRASSLPALSTFTLPPNLFVSA